MKDHFGTNLKRWNELVEINASSDMYDLEGFMAGKSSLRSIELGDLGDVSGKSLLHLMCHFGLDTLSWARLGAEVTGVDFSDKAIELARALSERLEIPARFVCSNVYDLPDVLDGEFDIVFTSYGVLCWLDDIDGWADVVSRHLKKGGTFYIVEIHPFTWVFEDDEEKGLAVKYPYFHREEPDFFESDGTYADRDAKVENKAQYEWQHTLGDVVNALIKAGLRIEQVKEYPYSNFSNFSIMEKSEDGYYRFSNDYELPMLFSIRATK